MRVCLRHWTATFALSPLYISIAMAQQTEPVKASESIEATYWMDETAVVADRLPGPTRTSTWATSVLSRDALDQLPARSLSEALNFIPGVVVMEQSDAGRAPMVITRGFFGGGEAEYVLLLIDGVPANDLSTGLIDWERWPLDDIERIEVLRGGGSALYGDAALGAVVNVITRRREPPGGRVALSTGGDGEGEARIAYQLQSGTHQLTMTGTHRVTDGYRQDSDLENSTFRVQEQTPLGDGILRLDASLHRREQQEPGPLSRLQSASARRQAQPLYAGDGSRRKGFELSSSWQRPAKGRPGLSIGIGLRQLNHEQTRTILLTPDAGDTQFRDEDNTVLWSRSQASVRQGAWSALLGTDIEYGLLRSRYFEPDSRSTPRSRGEADRFRVGAFAETHTQVTDRLRTTAGIRYDVIHDQLSSGGDQTNRTFRRWTPRAGLNYAYATADRHHGHVYLNGSLAFKAPTLDQLFDQRQLGFGDTRFSISNIRLRPQKARSVEIGISQRGTWSRRRLTGEVSLALYRIDLDDEIDFDLATFRYGNILKSRHDGAEAEVSLHLLPHWSVTSTLNGSRVTFRTGENSGQRLKNLPRFSTSSRLQYRADDAVVLSLTHRSAGETYLDDGNTVSFPGFGVMDVRARIRHDSAVFYVDVGNLLNERYNSSGFLLFDPANGRDTVFVYPGRGRHWRVGVRLSI